MSRRIKRWKKKLKLVRKDGGKDVVINIDMYMDYDKIIEGLGLNPPC